MLWIDEVVYLEGNEMCCRLSIRREHVFVTDAHVEPLTAIEWMAQTVGAMIGLRDREKRQLPRPGYLIAVPEASFHVDEFRVGDELLIIARCAFGDDELASFECRVERGGETVAKGRMSVYRTPASGGPAQ
jgi:predicted hotdog family 3-hydroxylacyl-ACP dehydratase